MSAPTRTREWLLYRFWNHAGDLLYIGQTSRHGLARWFEHMRDQRWAHEVATIQSDPRVWYSEAEVLDAERDAIHAERPRYNIAHNGTNPHRVVVRHPLRVPTVRRVGWWRRVIPSRVTILVALWLTLAGSVTVWLWSSTEHSRHPVPAADATLVGIMVASVLFLLAWSQRRPRRRRR
jgi:hypothetical protein